MGNGREGGWAVTVISFSGIHLFFSLFVSSFSFLESSVIDLWEVSFCFWLSTRITVHAAIS